MFIINETLVIQESEVELSAIRSQGAGGQNVNKVSSAIHLRFDINASSLDEITRNQLLQLKDRRISKEGIIVIKAQRFRTQEKNREDAIQRLLKLIKEAAIKPKSRRATKPTKGSQQRRINKKTSRGRTKALRGKVSSDD